MLFLLRFFGSLGKKCELKESSDAPDVRGRSLFVCEEPAEGRKIVVEHIELTNDDFKQAQMADLEQAVGKRRSLSPFNALELAASAVMSRIAASQMRALEGYERILLMRNKVQGVTESAYLWAPFRFTEVPTEHGYLIARGRLLQCW